MASQKREAMGSRGEKLVAKLTGSGSKRTSKNAPFDVVDFQSGVAYEVKTVSGMALSSSNKIHIETEAWIRKQAFLEEYDLMGSLMVVVLYSRSEIEVYRTELKQHVRISTVLRTGERVA